MPLGLLKLRGAPAQPWGQPSSGDSRARGTGMLRRQRLPRARGVGVRGTLAVNLPRVLQPGMPGVPGTAPLPPSLPGAFLRPLPPSAPALPWSYWSVSRKVPWEPPRKPRPGACSFSGNAPCGVSHEGNPGMLPRDCAPPWPAGPGTRHSKLVISGCLSA